MRKKAASISIHRKIGKLTKEIEKDIDIEKIEQEMSAWIQELNGGILPMLQEILDDAMREEKPKG